MKNTPPAAPDPPGTVASKQKVLLRIQQTPTTPSLVHVLMLLTWKRLHRVAVVNVGFVEYRRCKRFPLSRPVDITFLQLHGALQSSVLLLANGAAFASMYNRA